MSSSFSLRCVFRRVAEVYILFCVFDIKIDCFILHKQVSFVIYLYLFADSVSEISHSVLCLLLGCALCIHTEKAWAIYIEPSIAPKYIHTHSHSHTDRTPVCEICMFEEVRWKISVLFPVFEDLQTIIQSNTETSRPNIFGIPHQLISNPWDIPSGLAGRSSTVSSIHMQQQTSSDTHTNKEYQFVSNLALKLPPLLPSR